GFADVEPRQDHGGIDHDADQIRSGQPLDIATAAYGAGDDRVHQQRLDEIAEDEVEAGAQHQGAGHRQHHPGEQHDQPFRRADPEQPRVTGPTAVAQVDDDGEQ